MGKIAEPGAEAPCLHELAEAHTAVGFYLSVVKRMLEDNPGPSRGRLSSVIQACIAQSERGDEALRNLRRLLMRPQDLDRRGKGC